MLNLKKKKIRLISDWKLFRFSDFFVSQPGTISFRKCLRLLSSRSFPNAVVCNRQTVQLAWMVAKTTRQPTFCLFSRRGPLFLRSPSVVRTEWCVPGGYRVSQ